MYYGKFNIEVDGKVQTSRVRPFKKDFSVVQLQRRDIIVTSFPLDFYYFPNPGSHYHKYTSANR